MRRRFRRRVGVKFDFFVLISLALDPAFALLDVRGQPGHIQMMQGLELPVRVDAGPHGFGGANQNSDAPAVDVGEQPLLGARLLVVLHEGDLGAWDAELDQAGSDPAIGRKAARRLDVEGAKIGEDHLSCPGQGIGDAVRPRVAAIRRLRPDRIDIVDQRIELVARLVLIVRQNEAQCRSRRAYRQ